MFKTLAIMLHNIVPRGNVAVHWTRRCSSSVRMLPSRAQNIFVHTPISGYACKHFSRIASALHEVSATPAQLASNSEFLSPSTVTFATLGVSQDIVDALERAGYDRPAYVQVYTSAQIDLHCRTMHAPALPCCAWTLLSECM